MKKEYFLRRALTVTLVLALVATMAVFSVFSWYDRTARADETGKVLSYTQTGKVNNYSGIKFETYAGTYNNGEVTYSETALSGAVDVKEGEVNYFKTVLIDTANAGGAVVSLYLKDFSYNTGMGEKVYIGLVNPEKTYKSYTGVVSGSNRVISNLCLEDNIIVPNNGVIEVQWFVKSSASYSGTKALNPGTECIAYN